MSTLTHLDVSRLPRALKIGRTEVAGFTAGALRPAIEQLIKYDAVKSSSSFGFAMTHPTSTPGNYTNIWDEPFLLTGVVVGWGPDADRYIANAVRKLRPAARTEQHTIDMDPGEFCDIVLSQEPDGSFAWGDFPHGGAVFGTVAQQEVIGAVSGFTAPEDHVIAQLILGLIRTKVSQVSR